MTTPSDAPVVVAPSARSAASMAAVDEARKRVAMAAGRYRDGARRCRMTVTSASAETTSAVMGDTTSRVVGLWKPRGAGDLLIPVSVVDRRVVFGKAQFKIMPWSCGDGAAWMSSDAVVIATVDDVTGVSA